jgi:hypothetical protein
VDSNLLALIAIAVLAVIIALTAFRFWARRRMRETAAERRVTAVPEMLQAFGRSVVLGTDPAGATSLVEALPRRKAKPLGDGTWGIDYITRRDVVIEVRPHPAGSEVLVTSLVEHSGFPQGLSTWQTITARLEEAAAAAGISVQRGEHGFRFAPPPPSTLDRGAWVVAS